MALLPYTNRVTTQRSGGRGRGEGGDRGGRRDRGGEGAENESSELAIEAVPAMIEEDDE